MAKATKNKKSKEGRHVGLDFYDLLIEEALFDKLSQEVLWHAASNNPSITLLNKHAISVGVEAVSLGNAMVVSPEDIFLSRQGADQHQECRLGQVEVSK